MAVYRLLKDKHLSLQGEHSKAMKTACAQLFEEMFIDELGKSLSKALIIIHEETPTSFLDREAYMVELLKKEATLWVVYPQQAMETLPVEEQVHYLNLCENNGKISDKPLKNDYLTKGTTYFATTQTGETVVFSTTVEEKEALPKVTLSWGVLDDPSIAKKTNSLFRSIYLNALLTD